jgi:hypothetical protein
MIHNKAMYKRYYDSYMNVFVEAYCKARDEGNTQESALIGAKIMLQNYVTTEMFNNKPKTQIILKVYNDIKKDQLLYEKAISHFEGFKN